jgi:hypothetical protein
VNHTIPTPTNHTAPALTLDELAALSMTARELDTVAAYRALCGGSVISWVAKMRVAS